MGITAGSTVTGEKKLHLLIDISWVVLQSPGRRRSTVTLPSARRIVLNKTYLLAARGVEGRRGSLGADSALGVHIRLPEGDRLGQSNSGLHCLLCQVYVKSGAHGGEGLALARQEEMHLKSYPDRDAGTRYGAPRDAARSSMTTSLYCGAVIVWVAGEVDVAAEPVPRAVVRIDHQTVLALEPLDRLGLVQGLEVDDPRKSPTRAAYVATIVCPPGRLTFRIFSLRRTVRAGSDCWVVRVRFRDEFAPEDFGRFPLILCTQTLSVFCLWRRAGVVLHETGAVER